jgi:uncharacterized OB-fold protein
LSVSPAGGVGAVGAVGAVGGVGGVGGVGPVARDGSTAEFFEAAAQGRFLIQRCVPAGHMARPQARLCPECGSTDLAYEPASGRARLVSWAVVPGRPRPDEPAPPPSVPVIAQLEEGPWWWSALVGGDPDSLREGQALRIVFERAEGGEAVPVFVVDTGTEGSGPK